MNFECECECEWDESTELFKLLLHLFKFLDVWKHLRQKNNIYKDNLEEIISDVY